MYKNNSLVLIQEWGVAVRVKGRMSLRYGMWHVLRNDIIMRNVKYGKGRKQKHGRVFAAPFFWPQFE